MEIPRGVVVKVSELKFQSCYSMPFSTNTLEKGMNPLIFPTMGNTPLLFFYNDDFALK